MAITPRPDCLPPPKNPSLATSRNLPLQARLEGAPGPLVPRSASNGWSTSWKKFMIEMSHLSGGVFLYPSFPNQSSLSTNHLEKGEHIGGKKNKLTHRPPEAEHLPISLGLDVEYRPLRSNQHSRGHALSRIQPCSYSVL